MERVNLKRAHLSDEAAFQILPEFRSNVVWLVQSNQTNKRCLFILQTVSLSLLGLFNS